jgi:hypothetical protein
MFNTSLIRSTEIATAVTDVTKLKLEERMYIDRATAVGAQPATIQAPRPAAARPAAQPAQRHPEKKEPVTVATDGLEEL